MSNMETAHRVEGPFALPPGERVADALVPRPGQEAAAILIARPGLIGEVVAPVGPMPEARLWLAQEVADPELPPDTGPGVPPPPLPAPPDLPPVPRSPFAERGDRRAFDDAMARIGGDPMDPVDRAAASAYAAAGHALTLLGGEGFAHLGLSTPVEAIRNGAPAHAVALKAIAAAEHAAPGTLRAASHFGGAQPEAREAARQWIDGHLALALQAHANGHGPGTILGPDAQPIERTSVVDPALSAHSGTARAILAAANPELPQNWRAHHLVPFAVVTDLPVSFQERLAEAGWRMNSAENLVALPGDVNSYRAEPNNRRLPFHSGAHPQYSGRVAAMLAPIVSGAPFRSDEELRGDMAALEATLLLSLGNKDDLSVHPRLE